MAGKARVHELAKELGVTSKELLATLKEQGEFVKSASSTVEAPVARRLRESFPSAGGAETKSETGAAAPAARPAAKARRTVAVGCKAWRTASRPQAGRTRTGCLPQLRPRQPPRLPQPLLRQHRQRRQRRSPPRRSTLRNQHSRARPAPAAPAASAPAAPAAPAAPSTGAKPADRVRDRRHLASVTTRTPRHPPSVRHLVRLPAHRVRAQVRAVLVRLRVRAVPVRLRSGGPRPGSGSGRSPSGSPARVDPVRLQVRADPVPAPAPCPLARTRVQCLLVPLVPRPVAADVRVVPVALPVVVRVAAAVDTAVAALPAPVLVQVLPVEQLRPVDSAVVPAAVAVPVSAAQRQVHSVVPAEQFAVDVSRSGRSAPSTKACRLPQSAASGCHAATARPSVSLAAHLCRTSRTRSTRTPQHSCRRCSTSVRWSRQLSRSTTRRWSCSAAK